MLPPLAPVTAMLRNGFGTLNTTEAIIVIAELFILGTLVLRLAVHLFRYGSIQNSSKLSITRPSTAARPNSPANRQNWT